MRILMLAGMVIAIGAATWADEYNRYFTDRTMRVDYFHTGTKGEEVFSVDQVVDDGVWPGSKTQLLDTLNFGEYIFRVYDRATSGLIFSRGYSTIFNEWQTTDEAGRGVYKTFSETLRFPFPRGAVQVTIGRRDRHMAFRELFSVVIDPADPTMVNREVRPKPFTSLPLLNNGEPAVKVDIVILGDGYARADQEKLRRDAQRYADVLLGTEPFRSRKSDFNVWLVQVVSEESGIDIPDKNVWKRNALGCSYNTFGSARYVLTTENRVVRDAAAAVPYDFICILVNDSRYGGGGIYNLYTTTYTGETVRGQGWQMDYVFVHEFGHSFGGLGDEYYTASTSYNDFYPAGVEPWEPNVTAATDRAKLKWGGLIAEGTPVPTPWRKAAYDSLEALRGKLDRLAPDYYEKREPLHKAGMELLRTEAYAGTVGLFEGSGYASRGLFRPSADCRMFSLSLSDFDPVCRQAIGKVIMMYNR
jgi:hypothetical protein